MEKCLSILQLGNNIRMPILGMYAVVGKILSVLEDLDRYVFDKMDPNTNCLDVLAAKIWGPCQPGNGVSSQAS